jgi:hypothetical protein
VVTDRGNTLAREGGSAPSFAEGGGAEAALIGDPERRPRAAGIEDEATRQKEERRALDVPVDPAAAGRNTRGSTKGCDLPSGGGVAALRPDAAPAAAAEYVKSVSVRADAAPLASAPADERERMLQGGECAAASGRAERRKSPSRSGLTPAGQRRTSRGAPSMGSAQEGAAAGAATLAAGKRPSRAPMRPGSPPSPAAFAPGGVVRAIEALQAESPRGNRETARKERSGAAVEDPASVAEATATATAASAGRRAAGPPARAAPPAAETVSPPARLSRGVADTSDHAPRARGAGQLAPPHPFPPTPREAEPALTEIETSRLRGARKMGPERTRAPVPPRSSGAGLTMVRRDSKSDLQAQPDLRAALPATATISQPAPGGVGVADISGHAPRAPGAGQLPPRVAPAGSASLPHQIARAPTEVGRALKGLDTSSPREGRDMGPEQPEAPVRARTLVAGPTAAVNQPRLNPRAEPIAPTAPPAIGEGTFQPSLQSATVAGQPPHTRGIGHRTPFQRAKQQARHAAPIAVPAAPARVVGPSTRAGRHHQKQIPTEECASIPVGGDLGAARGSTRRGASSPSPRPRFKRPRPSLGLAAYMERRREP